MMHTHRLRVILAASAVVAFSACASKSGKVTTAESAGSVASSATSSASSALSGALGPASALIGGLTKSIPGLSQAQAILGAGSIFGLAKAKMPGDQFSQLASSVPGAQALVDEATKAGLPAAEQLTGLASLTPLLSKAGINSSMVSQLVPALAKAVGTGGGQGLANAFLAAVKRAPGSGRRRDGLAQLFLLLISHRPESGDADCHGGMGSEPVGDPPLAKR